MTCMNIYTGARLEYGVHKGDEGQFDEDRGTSNRIHGTRNLIPSTGNDVKQDMDEDNGAKKSS